MESVNHGYEEEEDDYPDEEEEEDENFEDEEESDDQSVVPAYKGRLICPPIARIE